MLLKITFRIHRRLFSLKAKHALTCDNYKPVPHRHPHIRIPGSLEERNALVVGLRVLRALRASYAEGSSYDVFECTCAKNPQGQSDRPLKAELVYKGFLVLKKYLRLRRWINTATTESHVYQKSPHTFFFFYLPCATSRFRWCWCNDVIGWRRLLKTMVAVWSVIILVSLAT